eukprot:5689420-Lingulodinium_polyedra.AAC.1
MALFEQTSPRPEEYFDAVRFTHKFRTGQFKRLSLPIIGARVAAIQFPDDAPRFTVEEVQAIVDTC